MSTHGINMDAIQAGVEAFLQTYPDEAALDGLSPTSGPKGAHAVLWIDDWWRGVDMAREALAEKDFRPERVGTYPGQPKVDLKVACTAAIHHANFGTVPDLSGEYIDADAVVAFCAAMGALWSTGTLDVDGNEPPTGIWSQDGRWMLPSEDPEVAADLAEPG